MHVHNACEVLKEYLQELYMLSLCKESQVFPV
jgi:hypothetical protein